MAKRSMPPIAADAGSGSAMQEDGAVVALMEVVADIGHVETGSGGAGPGGDILPVRVGDGREACGSEQVAIGVDCVEERRPLRVVVDPEDARLTARERDSARLMDFCGQGCNDPGVRAHRRGRMRGTGAGEQRHGGGAGREATVHGVKERIDG